MKRFSFPIRLKVLVTVLFILMLVVGVIMSTMTNLFREDKTAYVRDYIAAVTNDVRAGMYTQISSYVSASRVLSEVLFAAYLSPDAKERLVGPMFAAYPDLLAMVSTNANGDPVSVYNAAALQALGATPDSLAAFGAAASELGEETIAFRRTTLGADETVILFLMKYPIAETGELRPVTAIVAPRVLRTSMHRGRAFDSVLLGADQELIVTTGEATDRAEWAVGALGEFENLTGSSVVDYTTDSGNYIVGAAQVGATELTVVTRISASTAYFTARQLLNNLIVFGLITVLVAALAGVALSRRITRPLERLSTAARKIGKGDFDVNVAIHSHDEIGELSGSFNNMVDELNQRELSLKKAQLALVQSEKMAAVGTLTAGLAHEVKNPLSAVLGYAQLAKRKVPEESALQEHLNTIESETRRCNDIIGNLMQFSRQEKGEFEMICVNDVVEKSVGIVDHQLSLRDVKIETSLQNDIPKIRGNSNQLQQVLMNLTINAQQAMGKGGGVVSIRTASDDKSVAIIVDDTGPGIDPDLADKIFEPFYTTKPAGQGTGLGLSVTYGIVRDHNGDITIGNSEAGGARFTIRIPIDAEIDLGAANDALMEEAS